MNSCHWRCVIGTTWVPDTNFPNTCPEEEACQAPVKNGASGDLDETPCLPIGPGGG